MQHDELCKTVLDFDSKIRFTGVLNNKGELVAGGNRGGVESLLSTDDVSMSVHYTLQRWEKTKNLSYKIGNERFSVIEYEKVALITIPFNKRELFLISTEPDSDYFSLIKKTLPLLEG